MTSRTLISTLLAALALPASAGAATFSDPVTLADWSTGAGSPAAADGAAAWTQSDGVHLLGAGPISDGVAAGLRVIPGVAGWSEADGPHFWAGGTDAVPQNALTSTRGVAVTPGLGAWIGVAADGSKQVQFAPRSGSTFGAAQTLPALGTKNYGLVAAGDASGRSVIVWHARSDDRWRIQFSTVAADGDVTGSGWLTPPGDDNSNPSIAMSPDGSGVIAWTHGTGEGRIQARAVRTDGAFGPIEDLSDDTGSSTTAAAAGSDGTAVVAWHRGVDAVMAARRRPGAAGFGAAETVGGAYPQAVTASVTAAGDAVVGWTELPPGRAEGSIRATAAPATGAFDAPVTLGTGGAQSLVAAGGDRLVWDETRSTQVGADHRIRTATLLTAPGGGDPSSPQGDRTAPKLKLRVLGLRKPLLRVRVTSDEAARARLLVRSGGRRARTPLATLKPGKPTVLKLKVPRGAAKLRLELRATDAAGNARVVKRTVRR